MYGLWLLDQFEQPLQSLTGVDASAWLGPQVVGNTTGNTTFLLATALPLASWLAPSASATLAPVVNSLPLAFKEQFPVKISRLQVLGAVVGVK